MATVTTRTLLTLEEKERERPAYVLTIKLSGGILRKELWASDLLDDHADGEPGESANSILAKLTEVFDLRTRYGALGFLLEQCWLPEGMEIEVSIEDNI